MAETNYNIIQAPNADKDTLFGTVAEIALGNYLRITKNGDIYLSRLNVQKYVGTFKSSMPGTLATPISVGGIPAGTTIDDLYDLSVTQLMEMLLFPVIEPTIKTNRVLTIVNFNGPTYLEPGTDINITLTTAFNKGLIKNGDGSNGPALVGDTILFTYGYTGGSDDISVNAVNVYAMTNFPAGNIRFDAKVTYGIGVGAYYDSRNVASNVLDASRVADTSNEVVSAYVKSIRPFLYGMNAANFLTGGNPPYAQLTHDLTPKADKAYTFNGDTKHIYVAYPAEYGMLTEIKDGSGFVQDLANWDIVTVDILPNGLGTNTAHSYRIYRTKSTPTVNNQTYTFKF